MVGFSDFERRINTCVKKKPLILPNTNEKKASPRNVSINNVWVISNEISELWNIVSIKRNGYRNEKSAANNNVTPMIFFTIPFFLINKDCSVRQREYVKKT